MESTEQAVEPANGEVVDGEVVSSGAHCVSRRIGEVVVATIIIVLLINVLAVNSEQIGSSMASTFKPGDMVLASRVTYMLFPPDRGDVVVMRDPLNADGTVVRRVIGLPGEHIELRGRQVLINNLPLVEDYIGNPLAGSDNLSATIQLQLQKAEYYVLGDNRLSINDSRSWGVIKESDILGRAWLVYWPPDSISTVQRPLPASTSEK